jgi:hypothetical protein
MEPMKLLKAQRSVVWSLVYTADEFAINTETLHVRHRKALGTQYTYADVIGVYAYAIGTDGNVVAMVYVSRGALDEAAKLAPKAWAKYPNECAGNHALAKLETALTEKLKVVQ